MTPEESAILHPPIAECSCGPDDLALARRIDANPINEIEPGETTLGDWREHRSKCTFGVSMQAASFAYEAMLNARHNPFARGRRP